MRHLEAAAFEIGAGNGAVNRDNGEAKLRAKVKRVLKRAPFEHEWMVAADAWLATLTPEQLKIVCDGEERVRLLLLAKAPLHTNSLLNWIFRGLR